MDFIKRKLVSRLREAEVAIDVAASDRRFIALDCDELIAQFMSNGVVDRERFLRMAHGLMNAGRLASRAEGGRVFAAGQCAPRLWELGYHEAAIEIERLWNEVATVHNVDILCFYEANIIGAERDGPEFQQICAQHSSVC